MSDTCWLRLSLPRKDLAKFNKVLKDKVYNDGFWDEDHSEENDRNIDAIIYDANYGWSDEILELAKAGLTFSGEHSAGSEYGPMAFACYKGELIDVNTDHEGTPTITVPQRSTIHEGEMSKVNRYYDLLEKVMNEEG